MKEQPQITVLIPAYHSEKTIGEAISSVLAQDYPNLQLVISDDGTPGFDAAPLRELLENSTNAVDYIIIHREGNAGTVRNLNDALAYAKGEWVTLLAADDVFSSPHSLTCLEETAEVSGAPWILVRVALCDGSLQATGEELPGAAELALLESRDARALYAHLCRGSILPAGGMFRRELLETLDGFDTRYRLIEDWPLALKLVRTGIVPAVSEQVCMYHRDGGVSRGISGRNQAYQSDLIHVMEYEILPRLDLLDEKEQTAVRRWIEDKRAVYKLRFECKTPLEKARWVLSHGGVLWRKLKEKAGIQ